VKSFLRSVEFHARAGAPDKVLVLTDDVEFAEALAAAGGAAPVMVATSSERVERAMEAREVPTQRVSAAAGAGGVQVLDQASAVMAKAMAAGLLGTGERVMAVVYGGPRGVHAVFMFNVDDLAIAALRKEVEGVVAPELLEVVLQIAFEVAREGREGAHLGALFVLGDTDAAMARSRARIINPFQGHSRQSRLVFVPENHATIKQFAQLDGATMVDAAGVVVAAGRYIQVNWDVYLQGGLGGRHLAGASITKDTRAVAVVVSSSNVIRVFKGGREVYRVNAV
jgi:DNA integrity scanning protein DisA with diadenylate cyclase activity